jgi:hypothetical protein
MLPYLPHRFRRPLYCRIPTEPSRMQHLALCGPVRDGGAELWWSRHEDIGQSMADVGFLVSTHGQLSDGSRGYVA